VDWGTEEEDAHALLSHALMHSIDRQRSADRRLLRAVQTCDSCTEKPSIAASDSERFEVCDQDKQTAALEAAALAKQTAEIAFDLLTRSRQLALRETAYGAAERIAWMTSLPAPRRQRQKQEPVQVLQSPTMTAFGGNLSW